MTKLSQKRHMLLMQPHELPLRIRFGDINCDWTPILAYRLRD